MKLQNPWVWIQVSTPPLPESHAPVNMVAIAELRLSSHENAWACEDSGYGHAVFHPSPQHTPAVFCFFF